MIVSAGRAASQRPEAGRPAGRRAQRPAGQAAGSWAAGRAAGQPAGRGRRHGAEPEKNVGRGWCTPPERQADQISTQQKPVSQFCLVPTPWIKETLLAILLEIPK